MHSNPVSHGSQLNLHIWLDIRSHSSPSCLGLGLTGGEGGLGGPGVSIGPGGGPKDCYKI